MLRLHLRAVEAGEMLFPLNSTSPSLNVSPESFLTKHKPIARGWKQRMDRNPDVPISAGRSQTDQIPKRLLTVKFENFTLPLTMKSASRKKSRLICSCWLAIS